VLSCLPLPFLALLWNRGKVMPSTLNINLAMLRALDDESAHELAKGRLTLQISSLHTRRHWNQFNRELNELSVTSALWHRAFEVLLAHAADYIAITKPHTSRSLRSKLSRTAREEGGAPPTLRHRENPQSVSAHTIAIRYII